MCGVRCVWCTVHFSLSFSFLHLMIGLAVSLMHTTALWKLVARPIHQLNLHFNLTFRFVWLA